MKIYIETLMMGLDQNKDIHDDLACEWSKRN